MSTVADLPRSGPQGHIVPGTLIDDPCVWKGAELQRRQEEFCVDLTQEDLEELAGALTAFKATGLPRAQISKDSFPLTALAVKLETILEEIRDGRGFVVLRGFPISHNDPLDTLTVNLGLACYLGNLAPVRGSLTTQVRQAPPPPAANSAPKAPSTTPAASSTPMLGSQTSTIGGWHTDAGGDVLGLLCVRAAKYGGNSFIVSALEIHNELLRRGRGDILETLSTQDWFWDLAMFSSQGAAAFQDGRQRFISRPNFTHHHNGYLSVAYTQSYGRPGTPQLSESQREAIKILEEIAGSEEFRVEVLLNPGDLLLMNNHVLLHARSEFEDNPDAPRHLVRTWCDFGPGNRPIPEHSTQLMSMAEFLQRPSDEDFLRSGSSKFIQFPNP